jgi:Holliday junction resolvase
MRRSWSGKKRDENEPEIIAALESIGCDVVRLHEPVDLVVGLANRTVLLEVKMPGGTLTSDQKEFFESFRGEAYVVRSGERAIEVMTNGRRTF